MMSQIGQSNLKILKSLLQHFNKDKTQKTIVQALESEIFQHNI